MEHGNPACDVKGTVIGGSTAKTYSTDACVGGGLLRSSDEIPVMGMERRGQLIDSELKSTTKQVGMMQNQGTKSYEIDKRLIFDAYQRVRKNKGSAGIDNVGIEEYDNTLSANLYKLWNRMSSGSYFPKSVKLVEIPKSGGGFRSLGVPTVEDRIAQMSAVLVMEPILEPLFHMDSYGYRPGRSAHDAIGQARARCWKYGWVLDMDISKFFDTIDHEKLMVAVERHIQTPWILLYIRRWLVVPYQCENGEEINRDKGVAQGSVIGPLLANLFLHYTFDKWMDIHYKSIPFERYADDTICHCRSLKQAEWLKGRIIKRFEECGLKLNETKTRIVCCIENKYNGLQSYEQVSFDFLGYTFRPRKVMRKEGSMFTGFLPAISQKAKNRIRESIRNWKLNRKVHLKLEDIAHMIEPEVRGWIAYYGKFYPSEMRNFLREINQCIARWIARKYKRFRGRVWQALYWLGEIAKRDKTLFFHWRYGILPPVTKSHKGR